MTVSRKVYRSLPLMVVVGGAAILFLLPEGSREDGATIIPSSAAQQSPTATTGPQTRIPTESVQGSSTTSLAVPPASTGKQPPGTDVGGKTPDRALPDPTTESTSTPSHREEKVRKPLDQQVSEVLGTSSPATTEKDLEVTVSLSAPVPWDQLIATPELLPKGIRAATLVVTMPDGYPFTFVGVLTKDSLDPIRSMIETQGSDGLGRYKGISLEERAAIVGFTLPLPEYRQERANIAQVFGDTLQEVHPKGMGKALQVPAELTPESISQMGERYSR